MADPTKIIDYAKQRRDNAKQAVPVAQQQLAAAQGVIATANNKVTTATKEFAELEKQAADIRGKLSGIPTPADGAALLDDLEQTIIRLRTKKAAILNAQEELSAAQSDASLRQAGLAAASATLAAAEAALTQATDASKKRDDTITALGTAPLSQLNNTADNALNVPPFTNAEARIAADIPVGLRIRAEERRADETARMARISAERQSAEDAVLDEGDTNGGVAGEAGKLWAIFVRAEAAAKDFVDAANARFDQAQTTLTEVADPKNSPLTAEQAERISDASLDVARTAAAAKEKGLDDKRKASEVKKAAYDAATLLAKSEGKNPDTQQPVIDAKAELATAQAAFSAADNAWHTEEKIRDAALVDVKAKQAALKQAIQAAVAAKSNPDTDAAVIQAKTNLTQSQNALKAAEDAYKLSDHGILHSWEAAVPDTTWQLFDAFQKASEMLNSLTNSDPDQLKLDLTTAEENYVAARIAADASVSVLAQLSAEQSQRAAREQSARQAMSARLFSALRGDN